MNPWLKTLLVSVVGAVAGTADAFVTSTPTGGFAVYLAGHPQVALIGGLLAYAAHNVLSQIAPPSTVVTTSSAAAPTGAK